MSKAQPKSHKIDLYQSYPCPLCRGKLQLITLTEALGCNRCHLIFVVSENGHALSQIDITTRIWYWWGDQWKPSSMIVKENRYFAELAAIRLILILAVVILLCLLTKAPEFVLGFTLIILLLWISWQILPRNF